MTDPDPLADQIAAAERETRRLGDELSALAAAGLMVADSCVRPPGDMPPAIMDQIDHVFGRVAAEIASGDRPVCIHLARGPVAAAGAVADTFAGCLPCFGDRIRRGEICGGGPGVRCDLCGEPGDPVTGAVVPGRGLMLILALCASCGAAMRS